MEIVLTLGCGAIVAAAVILTPAGQACVRAVAGGAAARLRRADRAVGGVVGAARRQLAERRADARLQRRLRRRGRARPRGSRALAGGARRGDAGGRRSCAATRCSRRSSPRWLDANDIYARLQAPYGYWNATGLTAAMGVIGCLWLGARRAGHALLSALAYPAMGLLLVTLMLAYSRGALVALALGLVLWFCIVPLRLRGACVLLAGALGAGARGRVGLLPACAQRRKRRAARARDAPGASSACCWSRCSSLLTLAGLAIGFSTGRRALSRDRAERAGAVLLSVARARSWSPSRARSPSATAGSPAPSPTASTR